VDSLETGAGGILRAVLGAVGVTPRDVGGAPPGTHDFDVVLADGHVLAVEVTIVTDEVARLMWDAVAKRGWTVPGLARSWSLVLQEGTPIKALHAEVGSLLHALELVGVDRFNSREPRDDVARNAKDRLAALGVRYARSSETSGQPLVLVGTVGRGRSVGASDVNEAVEREAAKADNRRKLRAAGGGELFVWVDPHATDVHAALQNEFAYVPREPPTLPSEIRAVWVARYVFGPDGLPRAGVLLRGDASGWADFTSVYWEVRETPNAREAE
jgi:hypothetical protein